MGNFSSRETLQVWVDEFKALGYRIPDTLRVIEQDASGGASDGLVVLTFAHLPLDVYIQPEEGGGGAWVATIEPHEDPAQLTAVQMTNLSAELVGASALVSFLQTKG